MTVHEAQGPQSVCNRLTLDMDRIVLQSLERTVFILIM